MKEKQRVIIRISALALALVMLTLFSVGKILMSLPVDILADSAAKGEAQFKVSGVSVDLKKFEIITPTITEREGIKINVEGDYDDSLGIEYYALWAKNNVTGEVFYTTVPGPDVSPNFSTNDGKTNASPGTYTVTGLTAAMFTKGEKDNPYDYYYMPLEGCTNEFECNNAKVLKDKTFTITPYVEAESPFNEYMIGFNDSNKEVSIGDKITLSIKRIDLKDEINMDRRNLKTMMLSFTNESDGNVINMYVKSITGYSYIVVPSTATPGKYKLDYGYVTFQDGTTARYKNTDTKVFAYDAEFTVKEKELDTSKYMFNNELYNQNIAKDLEKLDNDAIITVDANNSPLINSEIFDSIKDTKRTLIIEYETSEWVFNGTDIKNSKTIDVSTLVSKLSKDNEYYNEFIKDNITSPSALLKFSDNGELPGKVLIKIDSDSINSYLKDPNSVYVYYYKEDSDQLLKVAMEIQANDGFYEFYINHNSKYIVTSKEVKTKAVSDNTELLSLNNQLSSSSSIPLTYILATICGVLSILLLIVLIAKRNPQQSQQTQES